jgi:hypothetical protein
MVAAAFCTSVTESISASFDLAAPPEGLLFGGMLDPSVSTLRLLCQNDTVDKECTRNQRKGRVMLVGPPGPWAPWNVSALSKMPFRGQS